MSAVAMAASVLLLEVDEVPIYGPLIGAVALAAWYGGFGPAVLVIALGWGTAPLLLVDPRGGLAFEGTASFTRWWINLVVAMVIAGVAGLLRVRGQRLTTAAAVAEETAREIQAFQDVTAALSAAVSSREVTRALTYQAAALLRAQGAELGIVEGEELVLDEPMGVASGARLPGGRLPLDRATLVTQSAREGVLVRVDDRAEFESSSPDSALLLPSVRAGLAVPLRIGGEVAGAVAFLFERERAVDDATTAAAVAVAGLAEQALERARLYEQERESRQALDRILRVAPRFQAETIEEVGAAICREARRTFGSDYGVLWRLGGDELELLCIDPPQEGAQPGSRFPLDDFPGLAGAVRSLGVAFVHDVLEEARGRGLELVRELGVRSSLRTPIVSGGRIELILALSWQMVVSDPDPSTLAVVRRFADQAALALEELQRRTAQQEAARRTETTRRLQEVTSALSLAATPLDVSNTCLEHALRSVGARAGFIVLIGGSRSEADFLASSGFGDEELERWRGYGLADNVPFARAIAGGEPVWALTADELTLFPTAAGFGDAGWVSVPLVTSAGTLGALHMSFSSPTELSEDERLWLQSVVSQCAQALERSRLFEEEQLLRTRAERVQAMTAALSNAVTRTDVADVVVAELGVALRADAAAVSIVHQQRDVMRVLAWRGWTDEGVAPWQEVSLDEPTPGTRVVRRRAPAFYGSAAALLDEYPELAGAAWLEGYASFLFVPLVAGRRAQGLLAASWTQEKGGLSADDLSFADLLASQAAQALERARQFESEQSIAETLQRSVLPVSLPRVDGVQLAARYLPGTAGVNVGGDWFDAMPLPDGKLGLVLGDVVGKGVSAAASMGQLRNALRAFSVDRLKPSSALARLNRLVEEALDTTFATIAYVVVDPATRVCRFASAGHPPPVLAFPDGRVELVEGGRGLPLGADEAATYRQEAVEVPAGTLLLLYSDGLVERRGHSIDEGLARLCEAVRSAPKDAERLLEHVLDNVVGSEERDDDIALLAARLLVVAPHPLDLQVQRSVESLDLVRDAVRVWLDGTPLGRAEVEDVMLATWEASANAIEHALDPTEDTIQIRARVDGTAIRVVIEDTGRWTPPSDRPDRGLGLRLIESTMSSVDIETGDGGTRITIEKRPGSRQS